MRRRRQQQGRPRAATLRDVAERAGVSTASASRALAHPAVVSDHLQKKVRDAASALAYVPNASARALSSSRAELVGAVLPGGGMTPPTLRALRAFERELSAAGVGVLLAITGEERTAVDCAHWLERRGAAAIALFAATAPVEPYETKHRPWAVVDLGLGRAVELAARYLYDLGHRRLCFVNEAGLGGSALRSRLTDLDELGIDFYRFDGVHATDVGRQTVDRLSPLRGDGPSALVCGSDLVAASVLRACLDNGIGVPRDVSIVAVGESGLATLTRPTLTSVRIAAEDGGAAAVRTILALLDGGSHEEALTSVKLVLRESAAAPR